MYVVTMKTIYMGRPSYGALCNMLAFYGDVPIYGGHTILSKGQAISSRPMTLLYAENGNDTLSF